MHVPASITKTFFWGYCSAAALISAILSTPKVFGVAYLLIKGILVVWSSESKVYNCCNFERWCSLKYRTEATIAARIVGKTSEISESAAKKSFLGHVFLCLSDPESNTPSFTSVLPTSITRFIFLDKAIKIQFGHLNIR